MDPITIIVMALAAGAAAGAKSTVEQAIKDSYVGIKAIIQRKYSSVTLTSLENKPESKIQRDSVQEALQDVGADKDQELFDGAKKLLEALEKHSSELSVAIGVDLKEVKAHALKIHKVTATGTGVKIERGEFAGDIEIGEVQAGQTASKTDSKKDLGQ